MTSSWQGSAKLNGKARKQKQATIVTSGVALRDGPAFMASHSPPKALRKSFISWTRLCDRLSSARFLHQHSNTNPPTNVADEDVKDAFFDQLQQAVSRGASSSLMPMTICPAVIGPVAHLSAQLLLTG